MERNTLASESALAKSNNEYDICKVSPYYYSSKVSGDRKLITVDGTSIWYQRYAPIRGLANLNFSIDENQHILLTGPNGSGKSTLAKTLCGVHRKFDGEIRISGKNLRDVDPIKAGFSKMVVQIPSQQIIFETVREEVCHSIRGLDQSFIEGRLSEIEPFLASFGLSLDEDPHTLSFGQQKVVCLLAHLDFPRVLFIDEPSISLDQSQQNRILDIIQFFQQHGVTTVIITQEPGVFRGLSTTQFTLEK